MNYAQFEKEAKNAGLYDSFSAEDLALAKRNPEKGMKILGYKIDYNNATTDEARALANAGAESERISEGYIGGADGNGSAAVQNGAPSSFGYTYEDFVKKAQDSGVWGQFSDADLNLAKQNADVGFSLLDGKMRYAAAKTPEEKAAINQEMNALRASYGGYTGGADGSAYIKNPISPGDFKAEDAPVHESAYEGDIKDLYGQIKNYKDFSYDAESDPLYAQYKKQYQREGQRATADTLGQAATMTGGIPSSYAATAAAQAGNYYAAQLTDKIPELYKLAYNQYLNEFDMLGEKLKTAQNLENTDYAKHLDDYTKWQNDRTFKYGQHIDEYNSQMQDRADRLQSALLGAQWGDYSGLSDMGINMDNNPVEDEKAYRDKVYEDDKANTEWSKDLAEREFAAKQSALTYDQEYNMAILAAQSGNMDPLNAFAKKYNVPGWTDVGTTQTTGADGSDGYTGDGTSGIESLKQLYPNGVVPKEEWNVLLSSGYSEDELAEAGLKKANLITNLLGPFA